MSEEGDRASAPPRALRALVEELRASEAPPIAWDEMEARLMAKIDAAGPLAAPGPARDDRAEILVPWDDEPDVQDETAQEEAASGAAESRPWAAGDEPAAASRHEAPRPSSAPTSRPAAVRPAPRRSTRIWGLAGVAVAAAAALMVWPRVTPTPAVAEPVDLAAVAVEPRLGDAFDLAGLRAGDVVEASEGPVSFGRAGVLRWTLSAGGRVRIVSGVGHEEPRHVVSLEQGALDVEVDPATPDRAEHADALDAKPGAQSGERFVVEVAGARVAVHGTAFRVVRSSRGVVLDVLRGVVAVGPLSGGEGSGQLIEAPARASFGLDGSALQPLPALAAGGVGKTPAPARAGVAREVVARNSDDERYAGMVEELAAPPNDREKPPSPLAPKAPESASAGAPGGDGVDARADQPWTADRVRSEVTACIARNGDKAGDGARVTIASSVVVDVDAAGSTRAVRFDPPIRPDLQACAQPVLRARFPVGTGRLLVPLEVRLGQAK